MHQSLLHMLDMRCGVVEVALAKPQVDPQRSDVAPRPEARPQQSTGVQPLQPLRIVDVDLSPGNTSGFARIRQDDSDAAGLQHLVHRHQYTPVDSIATVVIPTPTSQSAMRWRSAVKTWKVCTGC